MFSNASCQAGCECRLSEVMNCMWVFLYLSLGGMNCHQDVDGEGFTMNRGLLQTGRTCRVSKGECRLRHVCVCPVCVWVICTVIMCVGGSGRQRRMQVGGRDAL